MNTEAKDQRFRRSREQELRDATSRSRQRIEKLFKPLKRRFTGSFIFEPVTHNDSALEYDEGGALRARELLQWGRAGRVVIVDWDPTVTRLFRSDPALVALNKGALLDPRVEIIHRDVREVLAERGAPFDVVIGDLTDPDPKAITSAPLCSPAFYFAIRKRLSPEGFLVTHASSLDGASLGRTIEAFLMEAGFRTSAYAREVPSFGVITYVIGTLGTLPAPDCHHGLIGQRQIS